MSAARIAKARALVESIVAGERDDALIDPRYGTRSWIADEVAPVAVVLVHGFTNAPPQYDLLASQLAARGHAVIVPRVPYHGYRDRFTRAPERLCAGDWESAALEGVAIAALCGERVVVAGISVGATVAGWVAARTRIDTAIAVAPFCGIRPLYGPLNPALGALLRAAPNGFVWWDPRAKAAQPPIHGYPRFATRALGESLRVASEMDAVVDGAPHARRAVLVLNDREPAVNNAYARRRFGALAARGVAVDCIRLHDLPSMHDVIEPALPQARTDLVYPTLLRIVDEARP